MISMSGRTPLTAQVWPGAEVERTTTLHLIRGWPEGIAQK